MSLVVGCWLLVAACLLVDAILYYIDNCVLCVVSCCISGLFAPVRYVVPPSLFVVSCLLCLNYETITITITHRWHTAKNEQQPRHNKQKQRPRNKKQHVVHSSICACSSLRRGHANLLCIVPILTDDPRRESDRIRFRMLIALRCALHRCSNRDIQRRCTSGQT